MITQILREITQIKGKNSQLIIRNSFYIKIWGNYGGIG